MISTGSIYYDEIHRRANADEWRGKLERKEVTFEQWKNHWITTAIYWRDECEAEGLNITANHIQQIIRGQG